MQLEAAGVLEWTLMGSALPVHHPAVGSTSQYLPNLGSVLSHSPEEMYP